jgi:lysyl-tRNA synthetase class 2
VLQPIYGGATARPFITKHNALGQEFFLSISSELYLKRALVGGFDRVYSFSRCFRNEGISPTHNPEFTNLEIFESCKNGMQMNVFTKDLIKFLYDKFSKLPIGYQKLITAMPASDWPLSRKSETSDGTGPYAEAWEMYIDGMEIASGASDLNDPREQESRLKESEKNAIQEDKDKNYTGTISEYDPYDKNYIEALEQGLLPVAGVGIGVDRLCMLLLNKKNIRDTIMFPLLKGI